MSDGAIQVLMMPDYREGNPYQQLLADAIEKAGTKVLFPHGYRRVFPIFRAVQEQQTTVDVLHLHWLEPYLRGGSKNQLLQFIYALKFLIDIILTRWAGTRLVWTVHNQIEHDSSCPQLERWVRSILVKNVDRLIVHSQSILDSLAQESWFDVSKVDVIPHGHYRTVYCRPLEQSQARKQLNLPPEGHLYLHLGALRPYKGIEQLLEVWQTNQSQLANATLLIAGFSYDRAYIQTLQSLIHSLDRVIFYPHFVECERIHLFLSAADFVVLPYKNILTSGSVILAMSFGKSVIAPRLGAIPEVLGAADWLLYEPTDSQGLSSAIQRSINCPLQDLQELTAQMCDFLDWDTIGMQTVQSFRQCYFKQRKLIVPTRRKLGR